MTLRASGAPGHESERAGSERAALDVAVVIPRREDAGLVRAFVADVRDGPEEADLLVPS